MRSTIILLAALFIMLGAYFLFFYGKGGSTLNKNEINFAIEDTASIQRIVLSRTERNEELDRIVLERNPKGGWKLDGQYDAIDPRVQSLLETLHLIHVREIVKDKGNETAVKLMDLRHLLVEVYDDKELIRSIKVGTRTQDSKGTIMMLSEAKNPYVIVLPGFEGYPSARFNIDFDMWRENLLWNAQAESLNGIRIDYKEEAASVELGRDETTGNWTVKGVEGTTSKNKVDTYLSQFEGKTYGLGFVNDQFPGKMDSLRQQTPDITFSISLINDEQRKLNLYKQARKGANYLGWIEGENELRTVQPFVIDKFLVKQEDLMP